MNAVGNSTNDDDHLIVLDNTTIQWSERSANEKVSLNKIHSTNADMHIVSANEE